MKQRWKTSLFLLSITFFSVSAQKLQTISHHRKAAVANIDKIIAIHKQNAQSTLPSHVACINQACTKLKLRLNKLGSKKKFWWTGAARKGAIKKMNQHIAFINKLQQPLNKKHIQALNKMRTFLGRVEKLLRKHGDF